MVSDNPVNHIYVFSLLKSPILTKKSLLLPNESKTLASSHTHYYLETQD